ncbi:hypothetical protein GCM10007938_39770 [Vibrio zhanjiangensis]|uniref:AraC family transcriptional regulator n=1 Tax=Vibrio zhanjiangensis TaxID=1046128 RepID=A0ABQ6F5D9_9VIBR|nr:hypothetical protein [Vibrio zhanjiangensis]GLT20194.1 hypothetical protein GCM10007938_39770 [Vibrio zhanjiangensis]
MMNKIDIDLEISRSVLMKITEMSISPDHRQALIDQYGVSPQRLRQMSTLGAADIAEIARSRPAQGVAAQVLEQCLGTGVPKELLPYLEFNACRAFIRHFFGVTPKQYASWAARVPIDEGLRQRVVPADKEVEVYHLLCDYAGTFQREGSFCKEPNVVALTHQNILAIAQTCQISIRAIWSECEKWKKLS